MGRYQRSASRNRRIPTGWLAVSLVHAGAEGHAVGGRVVGRVHIFHDVLLAVQHLPRAEGQNEAPLVQEGLLVLLECLAPYTRGVRLEEARREALFERVRAPARDRRQVLAAGVGGPNEVRLSGVADNANVVTPAVADRACERHVGATAKVHRALAIAKVEPAARVARLDRGSRCRKEQEDGENAGHDKVLLYVHGGGRDACGCGPRDASRTHAFILCDRPPYELPRPRLYTSHGSVLPRTTHRQRMLLRGRGSKRRSTSVSTVYCDADPTL
eukprot:IDg607t1